AGFLSSPFRSRFGIFNHVEFYPVEDLVEIIRRSARIISIEVEEEAIEIMAQRARGTPRIANRLLKRVRDYATVKSNGKITTKVSREALEMEGIDSRGLDDQDRKFLDTIIDFYDGGPVGIEALAATLNEESDTLRDMIEPYLLQIGFLKRTRKGRVAGVGAYEHLNKRLPGPVQQEFWK
ncbi:Holliday junction DNA helicase RuvB C-terminal domain-containing protein, partial [Candidatus Hydrogenedentota bacterium]